MKFIFWLLLFVCANSIAQTNNFNILDSTGYQPGSVAITGGTINGATINGNTIASGTGTLALGAGKTTTFNHTSTFTTTDAQTYTFPTTNATIARTDIGQTFTGNQAFNNGPSDAALTLITSAGGAYVNFQPQNTHFNWRIGCQFNINNGCEITPSTIVGGSTFSTPVFGILTTGVSITGSTAMSSSVTMPGLAASSAATTGTLCWTTGTGNVNVDTTLACLASTKRIKELIDRLDGSLNTILALRPVHYHLKKENNPFGLGEQVGLIAEDVQKVDDRLVGRYQDGTVAGVRYMQLTAVLVGAVQEQNRHINELWIAIITLFTILIILIKNKSSHSK